MTAGIPFFDYAIFAATRNVTSILQEANGKDSTFVGVFEYVSNGVATSSPNDYVAVGIASNNISIVIKCQTRDVFGLLAFKDAHFLA
jgi:hypothetical protein